MLCFLSRFAWSNTNNEVGSAWALLYMKMKEKIKKRRGPLIFNIVFGFSDLRSPQFLSTSQTLRQLQGTNRTGHDGLNSSSPGTSSSPRKPPHPRRVSPFIQLPTAVSGTTACQADTCFGAPQLFLSLR